MSSTVEKIIILGNKWEKEYTREEGVKNIILCVKASTGEEFFRPRDLRSYLVSKYKWNTKEIQLIIKACFWRNPSYERYVNKRILRKILPKPTSCLLYTSDAADE